MADRDAARPLSADRDALAELWPHLDRLRGMGPLDLRQISLVVEREGLRLSSRDIGRLIGEVGLDGREPFSVYPSLFAAVFESLIDGMEVNSVLDCWVQPGGVLQPTVDLLKPNSFVGLQGHHGVIEICERFYPSGDSGQYLVHGNLSDLPPIEGQIFDLIIGCPPAGMGRLVGEVDGLEITARPELYLFYQCSRFLSDEGTALMLLPARTLEGFSGRSWWDHLELLGLRLDAAVHFLPKTFSPSFLHNCYLAVVRKGSPSASFFAAEANAGTLDRMLGALGNLDCSADHPLVGVEGVVEDFSGFKWLKGKAELKTRRSSGTLPNFPEIALSDICASIERLKKGPGQGKNSSPFTEELIDEVVGDGENILFWGERQSSSMLFRDMGLATLDPAVVAEKENRHLKWYVLFLNPELASARFMSEYLNGQYGGLGRNSVPPNRRGRTPLGDWPLWIPPLEEQLEIGRIDREFAQRSSTLSEASEDLWRTLDLFSLRQSRPDLVPKEGQDFRDMHFEEWIDTLPFPLATALWGYRVEQGDMRSQRDQLDWFFETLNAFVGILFLSVIYGDDELRSSHWPDTYKELQKVQQHFERPSRGMWTTVVEKCAKKMRSEIEDGETVERWKKRFACSDTRLLDALASKELVKLLRQSNAVRNRTRGHGAPASETQLADHVDEYVGLLNDFRGLFSDLWRSYPMVHAQKGKYIEGRNHTEVDRTVGSRTPFAKGEVVTIGQLSYQSFNMLNEADQTHLELLPFLQGAEAPQQQPSGVYFFGGYTDRQHHECKFLSCSHPGSAPSETSLQIPGLTKIIQSLEVDDIL